MKINKSVINNIKSWIPKMTNQSFKGSNGRSILKKKKKKNSNNHFSNFLLVGVIGNQKC